MIGVAGFMGYSVYREFIVCFAGRIGVIRVYGMEVTGFRRYYRVGSTQGSGGWGVCGIGFFCSALRLSLSLPRTCLADTFIG